MAIAQGPKHRTNRRGPMDVLRGTDSELILIHGPARRLVHNDGSHCY